MNTLLEWLSGGDLRSDGAAGQVADTVLRNENLIADLMKGLGNPEDVIRGRTADALEKVARIRPDLVLPFLPEILERIENDRVMMVRMHIAMLLGHLAVFAECVPQVLPVLMEMLEDPAVFTRSWAITSLCIIARKYPQYHQDITQRIASLASDASAAIRTRTRYAMEILTDPDKPFPKGWIKSEKITFS